MVLKRVVERLRQDITGVEGINNLVAVLHYIGVGAVGVEGQASVGAGQRCSQAAGIAKTFLVAAADR